MYPQKGGFSQNPTLGGCLLFRCRLNLQYIFTELQKLENMSTKELVFSHIKDQLAAGQLEAAIREIRPLAPNQLISRELKKYQFLLSRIKKLGRQGILPRRELHQARSKVHLALLEVLWEVEKAPSSLGLFTALLRIPLGWKIAIASPLILAVATYFWLAFPYPFELPDLEEPESYEYEQEMDCENGSCAPFPDMDIVLKRVGP